MRKVGVFGSVSKKTDSIRTLGSDMLSCISSLNGWLWRWCPANHVDSLGNWQTVWGGLGLIWRDNRNRALDGAAHISRYLPKFIREAKP